MTTKMASNVPAPIQEGKDPRQSQHLSQQQHQHQHHSRTTRENGGVQSSCYCRWIGQYMIIGCGLFIYLYFLFGKLSFLSLHLYQPMISTLSSWMIRNELYQNDKAATPLFMIVIPMLLAGMIASLCHMVHDHHHHHHHAPRIRATRANRTSSFHWFRQIQQRIQACFMCGVNHTNGSIAVAIYIPLLIYTSMSLVQKSPFSATSWQSSNRNNMPSEIGNTFGIAALFGMSFLLVPVTKYSFILQYFTYTQSLGIQQRIHQSLGTFVGISVLFHVVLHIYRWYVVQRYNNVLSMLFVIPWTCWNRSSWTDKNATILLALCPQPDAMNNTGVSSQGYHYLRCKFIYSSISVITTNI